MGMSRKPQRVKLCLAFLVVICTCFLAYNILGYYDSRTRNVARMVAKFEGEMETAWKRQLGRAGLQHALASPPETELHHVLSSAAEALTTRRCGQVALDGYSHVNVTCLHDSPTNSWHTAYLKAGGRAEDLIAHIEERADYDGLAVRWGINHKKASVEECAEACKAHKPNPNGRGPYDALPCNTFVWCGAEICFEPDAHRHTLHDCWLKFSEAPAFPELDMRGHFPDWYRAKHPSAPPEAQWSSGVLLPPGVDLTNGTWSVRWHW